MKTLSISRLCLIVTLTLGLYVALSVAMPQGLGAKEASLQTGGACRYCDAHDCPSNCNFVGTWAECQRALTSEKSCNQAVASTRGCKGGGSGCRTVECCDYATGETGCTN